MFITSLIRAVVISIDYFFEMLRVYAEIEELYEEMLYLKSSGVMV